MAHKTHGNLRNRCWGGECVFCGFLYSFVQLAVVFCVHPVIFNISVASEPTHVFKTSIVGELNIFCT